MAPIEPIFEGGSARQKNAIFLVNIFQKVPKNAFLPVFEKFACGAENFRQNRVLIVFSESSKNQIGRTGPGFEKATPPPRKVS